MGVERKLLVEVENRNNAPMIVNMNLKLWLNSDRYGGEVTNYDVQD